MKTTITVMNDGDRDVGIAPDVLTLSVNCYLDSVDEQFALMAIAKRAATEFFDVPPTSCELMLES